MNIINSQKLLLGILSLILMGGMISPAFAGTEFECTVEPSFANIQISQKDGSDFVDKKITCNMEINTALISEFDCVNYWVNMLDPITDQNMY